VEGFRFRSGSPVVDVVVDGAPRRLAVVRSGSGRSRLERWRVAPRADGAVGEITVRDLAALLEGSGSSSVDVSVFLDGAPIMLRLDPARAMGGSGRVEDAAELRDSLARLGPDDRRRLADSQVDSAPYGDGDAPAVRARLRVLLDDLSDASLLAAARERGEMFGFWDDDLHAGLLARPGGDRLVSEIVAVLAPFELPRSDDRPVVAFDGAALRPSRGLLPGVNDLVTTDPLVAAEADGWDPATLRRGSNAEVRWRCPEGHAYLLRVDKRTLAGQGCRACDSVAFRFPALAAEADGWDPWSVAYGSQKSLPWRCPEGHRYSARAASRTIDATGCPFCSGRLPVLDETDLVTTHPDLAAEALGWDPRSVTRGSNKTVTWRCGSDARHIWSTQVKSRALRGSGCPFCSGRLPVLGETDLVTTHPDLAAEALGWDPATVSHGSEFPGRWRCARNPRHVWTAKVKDRVLGTQCPRCAPGGFDQTSPGWLYLLEHPAIGMLKVGISNVPRQRLRTHVSKGWEVVGVEGPMSGERCREIELRCLAMLKDSGARFADSLGGESFDGWTEAWLRKSFPVSSLGELLERV